MLDALNDHVAQEYSRSVDSMSNYKEAHGGRYVIGVEKVLEAHYLLADYFLHHGEPMNYGLRDPSLLVSALDRQTVGSGSKTKWIEPFDIAATLFFGLVKNHAFHDGNKRTALLTVLYQLWICSRTFIATPRDLERLTVALAANGLREYPAYERFAKRDDPEVRFVSWYLQKNSREIDRRDYVITYRELQSRLGSFGYSLENPKGNSIDVMRHRTVTRRRGLFRKTEEIESVRVCTIGFPSWTTQIGRRDLMEIRRRTELTAEHGVDSQVFFKGASPLASFIDIYEGPLRRLARK